MAGRLEGKIAIVTGASRGIGAATARAFAAEGAKVVIASRKQEGLDAVAAEINADIPDSIYPKACHIGDPEQIQGLIDWAQENLGTVNVLVNNAATNPYFGPMLQTPMSAWDKTFDVNLKGYFVASREVAQRLLDKNESGSIINVSSITGVMGSPFQGVYAMTKAAIISMTKTLAVELGAGNIRFNAIAPGVIDTKLAAALTTNDTFSKIYTERAALHRIGQPSEITGLMVFLASDESSYMTGQTLTVDGGYTIA